MDITVIIEALITLLVAICTTFLIPWLKQKVEAEKLQKVLNYVDVAVGAAEQLAKVYGWCDEKKKDYVVSYLTHTGIEVEYDVLDAMIENAVILLHNELRAE